LRGVGPDAAVEDPPTENPAKNDEHNWGKKVTAQQAKATGEGKTQKEEIGERRQ
jgi:hypothetical protein